MIKDIKDKGWNPGFEPAKSEGLVFIVGKFCSNRFFKFYPFKDPVFHTNLPKKASKQLGFGGRPQNPIQKDQTLADIWKRAAGCPMQLVIAY